MSRPQYRSVDSILLGKGCRLFEETGMLGSGHDSGVVRIGVLDAFPVLVNGTFPVLVASFPVLVLLAVDWVGFIAGSVRLHARRRPAVALAAGEGMDGEAPAVRGNRHMGCSRHHRVSSRHVVAGTRAVLAAETGSQEAGGKHRQDRPDPCRRRGRGGLPGDQVPGTAAGRTRGKTREGPSRRHEGAGCHQPIGLRQGLHAHRGRLRADGHRGHLQGRISAACGGHPVRLPAIRQVVICA